MEGTREQMVPLTEVHRLRESRQAKDAALAELDGAVAEGLPRRPMPQTLNRKSTTSPSAMT
jgi:hypothetical protein